MPPELIGVLYHAEKHLKAFHNLQWISQFKMNGFRKRKLKEKHINKVQKLVAKAAKIINNRNITLEV